MTMIRIASLVALIAMSCGSLHAAPTGTKPPCRVTATSAGLKAVAITGKFDSLAVMAAELRLDKVVGKADDREYVLHDILRWLDTEASGHVALWRVQGPQELITAYVERLRRAYLERAGLYDFAAEDACVETYDE